jgi:serine/threonine protein kinase
MASGDDCGPSGTEPLGPELGTLPTEGDTRPSAGSPATPLETAGTVAVTPLEAAGTVAATPVSAFESARTTAATAPDAAPDAGVAGVALRAFGPYTRVEALGQQGNMGVVARGYNHGFARWELLKFLKPELQHDAELLRQFRREGRALARLSHPNVVQVYAMYDLDAQPCIAMEFLEGSSLGDELGRAGGHLPQARAEELLLDAARGLAAAHELGLLHRDIKPDNLFVTLPGKGRVAGLKLIDFGLATADKARPEAIQQDPTLASDATGGTPLFLAPELWQGRDPSPRSDLYALGVSFYLAVTGRYPFKDSSLHAVIAYCGSLTPPPSVAALRPELSAAFAALIDRLVDKNPATRFESAEKLVAELSALSRSSRPRRVPGAGPYRGLSAFGESERDVFFGRERDIAEITERLRTQLGLLLVGPVGCGKTSLARAGVAPAIRDGVLGGGYAFEAVVLEPGAQPLRTLAAVLSPILQAPEAELVSELSAAPAQLRALIERRLAPERGLLLVVDQLETLVGVAPDDAARFARAISSLVEVESPRLRLLASARSDVVDRLFALPSLRGLLTRGFHPVGLLDDAELEQAFSGPARTAGYSFEEPAILAEVVAETQGCPARLAVASLSLLKLWQKRDESRRVLSLGAWRALGGVAGVLAEHADAVWASLGAAERRAADDVVLRLISTTGKRHSARREALVDPSAGGEAAGRALERLLGARLCVEIADEVQLVHDALVSSWPRPRELLARVGVDQQLRQRVSLAAAQWQEQNKPAGLLWSGEQAERLLSWFGSAEQSFTLLELEFVAAVRKQATRGQRLRRVGLGAFVVVALAAGSWLVARERLLSAELGRMSARALGSERYAASEQARLYAESAELRLLLDPGRALRDAQTATRKVKNPLLDSVAWQALTLGVPLGLPLHAGGAGWVVSDGEYIVTSGADALHSLRLQGPGAGSIDLPPAKDGKPTAVSALSLAGDAWLGTVDGRVLRGRYTLNEGKDPQRLTLDELGSVPGGVREIATRAKHGRTFVHAVAGAEQAVYLADGGKLVLLWGGSARDVAIDAAGEELAIASPAGEVVVVGLGAAATPRSLGKHDASAVAWLGNSVVVGDEHGLLALLDGSRSPKTSSAALPGPVRRLSVAPSGRSLVAEGGDSSALFTPGLVELARLRVGAPAVRFLDAWRAVALVDEHQQVVVLGDDRGSELARLHAGSDRISSLGATESWLFASSLDGAVRAYALTACLPKPLAPVVAEGSAVSSSGALAALGASAVTWRTSQAGGADEGAQLLPEQAPSKPLSFSVGAGVGWLHDAQTYGFWDRKQVTTGDAGAPIQLLYALPSEPALVLAVASQASGGSRLLRARRGSLEQAFTELPGRPVAVAEVGEGPALAVLLPSGALRLVAELGKPAEEATELPTLERSAALAVAADGARFAVGFQNGRIHVGSLKKRGLGNNFLVSRFPVTCLAFGRDERVLVAGDEQGHVVLLDQDTERTFPLYSSASGAVHCGYDAARERFVFVDEGGSAWSRVLDTTPLSFLPPAMEPLEAGGISLWRGLEPATSR